MVREGYKECPFCAEEIREKAVICRFCNRSIVDIQVIKVDSESSQSAQGKSNEVLPESGVSEDFEPQNFDKLKDIYPEKVMNGLFHGLEKVQVGERRNITVLFADICGFTSLSENLDPEQIKEIIDGCYGAMVESVQHYGGLIDKFLGDAVMALFGAPELAHEDDPERAIRAALLIQEKIKQVGIRWGLNLEVSIGINCGEVVVGSFGSGKQMDYTAIGDTVNLASRLQGIAGRGQIFVGEKVFKLARGSVDFEYLGAKEIKGKREKVNCYQFVSFKEKTLPARLKERMKITPLIGRSGEMKKLSLAYKNASEGKPNVVLIKGEAGVGKSRLAYEFSKELNHDYVKWLNSGFMSYTQNVPYLPLIDIVKNICDIKEGDTKEIFREKIDSFVSQSFTESAEETIDALEFLLLCHYPGNMLLNLSAKDRKEKIFAAIERILQKLAEDKFLIIVLEDLHWADPISLEFIDCFIRGLKNKRLPILLILNYRPVFERVFPDDVDYVLIELEELSAQESQTLVRQILGLHKLPNELEERLLRHADGNPFFIEESILALRDEGYISIDIDTDAFVMNQPIEEIKIPDTIQGVILSRLDKLEEKLKNVLQCASVIGVGFRYRVLHYLMEVEQNLKNYLTDLIEQDYILETTIIPELIYLFKHTVTREVIYGTLLRKTRRFFHGKIGICLEDMYKDHLDEHFELLAHHFYNSENNDKSVLYLEKAAAKTEQLYANESAIEFNSFLIEVLAEIEREQGLTKEREEMLINAHSNRGRIQKLIGNYKLSIKDLEQAVILTEKYGYIDKEANILKILADILRLNGNHDDAISMLEKAKRIHHDSGKLFEVILVINNMGAIYRTQGKISEAIEKYKEALNLAEDCGELETKAIALNNLGITFLDAGQYDHAMDNFLRALDIKRNLLDKKSVLSILNNIGIINERKGEYEHALASYLESLKIAHEIGYHRGELACHLNLGQTYQILGNLDKSISHFKKVIEFSKGSEDFGIQGLAYGNLAWSLIYGRRLDSVVSVIEMALRLSERGRNFSGKINALLAKALYCSMVENCAEGIIISEKAIEELTSNNAFDDIPSAYRIYALNLLGVGRKDDALRAADEAARAAEKSNNIRELIWTTYTKGFILKKSGEINSAETLVNRAIQQARRIKENSFLNFNF